MNIMEFPPPKVDQSWYYYMYSAGLKGVPLEDILAFANYSGKQIREKDVTNWWRGHEKNRDPFAIQCNQTVFTGRLDEYREYPADHREPIDCYIPCTHDCKPLVKWSKVRCTEMGAWAYRNCEILGLNLRGLHKVVIDVDGDHDGTPDMNVINYWAPYINYTKARVKNVNGVPTSFHLEFYTKKIIPTQHFYKVDLLGNMNNQVQYLKPNKVANNLPMAPFDDYMMGVLKDYVAKFAGLDRASY